MDQSTESAVLPYARYLIGNGGKRVSCSRFYWRRVSRLLLDEKKVLTNAWVSALKTLSTEAEVKIDRRTTRSCGWQRSSAVPASNPSELLLMINVSATCIKDVQELARLCQHLKRGCHCNSSSILLQASRC